MEELPYTIITRVTPEQAEKWLEMNFNNRRINKNVVNRYAADMKNGRWDLTGDSICIATDGTLVNGQHRLSAIIESNTPVLMQVSFNMPKSMNYDEGRKRSTADNLKMATGRDYWRALTAAATLAVSSLNNGKKGSTSVVKQWLDDHEDVINALDLGTSHKNSRANSRAILLAMISACAGGVNADVIKRWKKLVDVGVMESPHDETVIRFRNWFYNGAGKRVGHESYDRIVLRAAQNNIRAFSEYRTLTKVRVPSELTYDID